MREHKYRALSSGKWWYSDDEAYVLKDDNGILKLYEDESFYNDKKRELFEIGEAYQFTGLHDCKGAEIYESDLLELDGGGDKARGEVIFEDGCFCFKAPWIEDGKKYPELKYYIDMTFVEAEVIGNIHQHPDLIRKD